MTQAAVAPSSYKSQPWVLFDTVASTDFTLGSATNAIGATTPAVSSNGQIMWFNSPGRTKSSMPWYTNLDTQGRLSYGMEVWQIYLRIMFPAMPLTASYSPNVAAAVPNTLVPPPTTRLAEAILNYSVLSFELGQENQWSWPTSQFTAGGGIIDSSSSTSMVQNGVQVQTNVMKLPEAIEMPNTQNLNALLTLAPEVRNLIGTGTGASGGVGSPLGTAAYTVANAQTNNLTLAPYALQLGFVGRRVKNVQYGQTP
jgi:hypothetical protein